MTRKYKKPEQDAMLAGAGDEDEFVRCFDDITGKELPWQAVKEAREKGAEVSSSTWRV